MTAVLVRGVVLAWVLLSAVVTAAFALVVRGGRLEDRARGFLPDLR